MTRIPPLSASERAAVDEFMAATRALLGDDFVRARLFGSRARGEGHEHSDLDLAIIVRAGIRPKRHVVYDLAFDIGLAHGVELAPIVIEESQLRELQDRERRIAFAIEVEGVPV